MKLQRGFTLVELAIVLVLVTILIGGLAVPLSAQIQARRIAETRASLQAIQEAILGYAMSNTKSCACTYDDEGGLLSTEPSSGCSDMCPAAGPPSESTSYPRHYLPCPDGGAGLEKARNAQGRCTSVRGGLPWRTLGVSGADAWGQRFTYAVTPAFTDNRKGFISTPAPATQGTLDIHADATCSGAGVARNVAVVIVSHGPNGRGAQNISGGTPLAPAAVPENERQNLAQYTSVAPCKVGDTDFVSRIPEPDFDDIVVWISPSTLFSRVCPPGGCR